MTRAGYELLRDRLRWRHAGSSHDELPSIPLDFRALVGLVIPARNPSAAVVAHVGIVPEQRGRGLAPQLVRRGTERLLASGADEIRGDCDRANIAMAKAFERAGYEQFARRRTYRCRLASARASA
jgi:RimJ/RimL family protein N-acetyltransferase